MRRHASGGAVRISGSTITVSGAIRSNGGTGGTNSNLHGGGGGGGSGGSIWLHAATVSLPGTVQALGGTAGSCASRCGLTGAGGASAVGRTHIDAATLTGTTSPAPYRTTTASTGTVCRAAVGVCDLAEVCSGTSAAMPLIAGLWGARAGARRAAAAGHQEAPPGRAPTRRFCLSAAWIRALLREDPDFSFPLERLITPCPPPSATRSGWWEFDASPLGGGCLLKNPDGVIERYFAVVWDGSEAVHLGVRIGEPAFQTFWEFCTLLLSLVVWGKHFRQNTVVIYGDNTAALANALNLKGRGILLHVAREIAWRQARRGWKFETAHLPSEHNSIADALSRITDPKGKQWPRLALSAAEADTAPRLSELWLAHPV